MAEEVPREKHKWTVNTKVYTRRARKKTTNPNPAPLLNQELNCNVGVEESRPNERNDIEINSFENNREEIDGVEEAVPKEGNDNGIKSVENNREKVDGVEEAETNEWNNNEINSVENNREEIDGVEEAGQNEENNNEINRVENNREEVEGGQEAGPNERNKNEINSVENNREEIDGVGEAGPNEENNNEIKRVESNREEVDGVQEAGPNERSKNEINSVENNREEIDGVGEAGPNEENNNEIKRVENNREEVDGVQEAGPNERNKNEINSVENNREEIDGVEEAGPNEQNDNEINRVENSREEIDGVEEAGPNERNDNEINRVENSREEIDGVEEAGLNERNNNEINRVENNREEVDGVVENTNDVEKGGEKGEEEELPLEVQVEKEANLVEPQLNSPHLDTISVDSSSLSRPEAAVSNGVWGGSGVGGGGEGDGSMVNGLRRSMVKWVDDRVHISVSNSSSREEVRGLKRKLVDELDQIRKMAKRLEVKEVQLSGYSNSGVVIDFGRPVDGNFPYSVNRVDKGLSGGMKMSSEMDSFGFDNSRLSRQNSERISFGFDNSRPARQLRVSVMDNNHGIGEGFEKEKRTPKANQFYRNSEFLLGKEKLPPAESNKKSKSAGGKKHGGRESDYGFGIDKQLFKSCGSLLQKLMSHKHGWIFKEPVDVKKWGLHDYFDIIEHPMDLGTVKSRLSNNWYKNPREFAEDVRLTFHNAMRYNPEGQDVHVIAKDLLKIFEDKWMSIEAEYERKLRYEMIHNVGMPTPTSRKTFAPANLPSPMSLAPPPLRHNPPSFKEARYLERSQSMPVPPESRSKPVTYVARTPALKKPKAKDPNKRDMTFDEKQKLSTNLQSLPTDKLEAIVQIIKKRNSALSQHDDEIEVDIDSVDTETLWELDRFVTNYKKNLSKRKRKAEIAQERAVALAAAAAQAVPETIPVPVNVEPTTENRQDQVNVATLQAQPERHSENVNDSSSSSSSSSDSGSSSSDSDSDSSSGSESDGGQ